MKSDLKKFKTVKTNFHLAVLSLVVCVGMISTARAENETASIKPEPPPYRPFALSLDVGTTGLGGAGSWRFADHWGARVGVDYLADTAGGMSVTLDHIRYDAKLQLLSEPLTLDFYPWKNHSFHISVGIMLNQNRLTGTADATGTITIGDETFPTDQVGKLNLKIDQRLVNPYLTIGGNFFYFDHARHWSLGGELGVAYTGGGNVSLYSSGSSPLLDQAVNGARKRLENEVDRYPWWPVAKLQVSYSF